ncbi:GNAT family N-acetyltransferase [Amycolatopsis alkalitolerans]|uniref:GNAT family N-acetyltransferase n=1 Tax=Amycolatopsis alkalitolerans TaxID=2547244 RepID=A0A5C4M6W1_9PSEU|nr:GNAT family N-acetyltransferase [Amycolatopsis alkalitolerans]TNC27708.1 GNAT family N-acetyltransferase [Amycolatopsis alkalitolerans]
MPAIRSARLDLVELTGEHLRLIAEGELDALSSRLGAAVSPEWADIIPAAENLKSLRDEPSPQPWLSRGILLREAGAMVGEVGFHNPPDELAVVELGYEVLAGFRRRGIATEAIRALTDWAYSTGEASTVYATIAHHNAASIGLVQALGFSFGDDYHDPVDGHVVFYERTLPLPR